MVENLDEKILLRASGNNFFFNFISLSTIYNVTVFPVRGIKTELLSLIGWNIFSGQTSINFSPELKIFKLHSSSGDPSPSPFPSPSLTSNIKLS